MSCVNVSTGYYRGGPSRVSNENAQLFTPGRVVLFSQESNLDSVYSPSFNVEAGQAAFVEAYNMPDANPIYVNRLVRASYAPPQASPCPPCNMDKFPGPDGIIVNRERMTLGDGEKWWQLFKDEASQTSVLQMLIVIPGTYELELSSVDMIGDLQVEYLTWNLSLTPHLPSVYYAGKSNIYGVI